jgi:Domain of unknown function (DUF4864)
MVQKYGRLSLITGLTLSMFVAAMLSQPRRGWAEDLPAGITEADRSAIQSVITDQIHAFQRDDSAAAFALASPSIQSEFKSPADFMRMVRDSYQAVYRPHKFQFLELGMVDGYLMQKLTIIGPDGLAVFALYPMVKLKSGEWRTDGCYLVPIASQDA